ncbi:MAG: type II toxin-antitoxin system RelB/DinJ family antitoxin [Kiritimatiellae bacterium]|nr:type II toxin-antitoxin system RelB/DinJ family antitoxin [Kiritimatiellia bacterium]MBR3221449.1 type II toxin-antitoxin system RelB/DinJ family antitoxin [Kiritimatiellia bacterium]
MNQILVQVRVDRDLKEQTASIYNAIGLDLPTAIRMFFKKSVMVGGLPFDGRVQMRDNAAISAFESMRAKVEATDAEEPSMDEINDFISSVRNSQQSSRQSVGHKG